MNVVYKMSCCRTSTKGGRMQHPELQQSGSLIETLDTAFLAEQKTQHDISNTRLLIFITTLSSKKCLILPFVPTL